MLTAPVVTRPGLQPESKGMHGTRLWGLNTLRMVFIIPWGWGWGQLRVRQCPLQKEGGFIHTGNAVLCI